jgi:hypothetical protein
VIAEFVEDLMAGKNVRRPALNFNEAAPISVAMLVRSCMAEPEERKNMRQLRSEVENVLKIKFVNENHGPAPLLTTAG